MHEMVSSTTDDNLQYTSVQVEGGVFRILLVIRKIQTTRFENTVRVRKSVLLQTRLSVIHVFCTSNAVKLRVHYRSDIISAVRCEKGC